MKINKISHHQRGLCSAQGGQKIPITASGTAPAPLTLARWILRKSTFSKNRMTRVTFSPSARIILTNLAPRMRKRTHFTKPKPPVLKINLREGREVLTCSSAVPTGPPLVTRRSANETANFSLRSNICKLKLNKNLILIP